MSELRQVIPIDSEFFCDGHYYVLTSSSLGGTELTATEVSLILRDSGKPQIEDLLRRGICIPLFFDGDCALDGNTVFVLGDLTKAEERDWIAKISGKLNIPCGKFVILCGGGDPEEFEYAISGQPHRPHYQVSQTIAVPPAEYLVEIYAYLSSMTVQSSLYEYDKRWNSHENTVLKEWYETNRPGNEDIGYIIRLVPLEVDPPLPRLVEDVDWCGEFEFRSAEV